MPMSVVEEGHPMPRRKVRKRVPSPLSVNLRTSSLIRPRYMLLRPDALTYTGVSLSGLYRAARAGELKLEKNGGRTVVATAELDRWLAERVRPAELKPCEPKRHKRG